MRQVAAVQVTAWLANRSVTPDHLELRQAALDLVEGLGLQEDVSVFLDMVRERDEAEGKGRVHSN